MPLLSLLVFGCIRFEADGAIAAPIKLGWGAANDPAVRGYAIYYGRANVTAATRVDVGTGLSCMISNLTVGQTYRIYAVSYDALGIESVPSNEVMFTAPAIPSVPTGPTLQIARLGNGSMRLSGAATPGTVCGIQFTSKLNPPVWQTLTNVTANSLSNVIAIDAAAAAVPQRFYRLALAPQPLVSAIKITRLANGAMRLDWTAPPNSRTRVIRAASPTASYWPTLANNVVADAEGRAFYVDNSAVSASSRFYQVVLP